MMELFGTLFDSGLIEESIGAVMTWMKIGMWILCILILLLPPVLAFILRAKYAPAVIAVTVLTAVVWFFSKPLAGVLWIVAMIFALVSPKERRIDRRIKNPEIKDNVKIIYK